MQWLYTMLIFHWQHTLPMTIVSPASPSGLIRIRAKKVDNWMQAMDMS
jgi:hypothetical protein